MDVQDGFITGIHNYCDRWCERCALASHCRVFAYLTEAEASLDSNFAAVIPARQPLDDDPDAAGNGDAYEPLEDAAQRYVPVEHGPIQARAWAYATATHDWLGANEGGRKASGDPYEVIAWFHWFVVTKIARALAVLPGVAPEMSDGDHDGSAKIALIAVERSHAAWFELIDRGTIAASAADPFIADLVWLGEALERVRPGARAFIRPGLDEPDAVARYRIEDLCP
jgi:hypothetical protein